jgi:hypothetical protein
VTSFTKCEMDLLESIRVRQIAYYALELQTSGDAQPGNLTYWLDFYRDASAEQLGRNPAACSCAELERYRHEMLEK